ncbi:MAG: Flp pilus assembly complex ATPase component TadA [Agathobacter sp.]|nr:Flp pilus assembly complex ATPase component TadA [Agathobacter sp.]
MSTLKLKDEDIQKTFPEIWKYLEDEDVTDLDFNCGNIWQSKVSVIPKQVKNPLLSESYWENFSALVGKSVNCNFNPSEHTAMADTETLRITCLHKSQSKSGLTNVNIRKSHGGLRINRSLALENDYCEEDTMNMLENCVRSHESIVFCGLPAAGKTEGLKLFASVIPKHEKVITIEDVAEIHYPLVNQQASCAELKVTDGNYRTPMETALRMNARRILMGEIRGENDMNAFLECVSNGIPIMTTTHTNDARMFPDRGVNMLHGGQDAERIRNSLHSYVNVSVLLKLRANAEGKIRRYIDQVCFFRREEERNNAILVVENGKIYKDRIPPKIRNKIEAELGADMFANLGGEM